MTRCIHCTRCVRFAEEIGGVSDLGTTGRGKATEIGTYVDKMMTSELSGNLVDLCPVGALTNGPYAFTSRPWELVSTNSVDLLDSLCPNVTFDKRGPEIMRSLPRVNDDVNEEWLSDKSRYSYDGLKRQRLDVPMIRDIKAGGFKETSWENALSMVSEQIMKLDNPSTELLSLVGEFSSLESIMLMRDLLSKFDNDQMAWSIHDNTEPVCREDFLLNSRVSDLSDSDVVVLVGCNLKYESPILNSKVLKGTRKLQNKTKVYTIGPDFDLGYKTIHLGNSTNILNQIVSGEHPFAAKLAKAQKANIIVSSQLSDNIPEYSKLNVMLKGLSDSLNEQAGKRVVTHGVLQNYVGHINANELGVSNFGLSANAEHISKHTKLIWNLANDNIRFIEYLTKLIESSSATDKPFVIYQGSHGDIGAEFADLILPSAAFTEENGTYVNIEGRVQVGNKVVPPPKDSKENWQIIRAMSEFTNKTLTIDSFEEMRMRLAQISPHLMKHDYTENSHSIARDTKGNI